MGATITRLNRWANARTNLLVDTLRVLFGAFIFYKGFMYLNETEYLYNIFKTVSGKGTYFVLVHYVAMAHLCGGIFIMMGLMTRLCSLIQLPILVGAITINFIGVMELSNLFQATIASFICVFFFFYGSGKHSVDYSLRLHM